MAVSACARGDFKPCPRRYRACGLPRVLAGLFTKTQRGFLGHVSNGHGNYYDRLQNRRIRKNKLSRAIGALEAEGIRFSDDGVFLQACRTGTNRGHGSLGGHSVMNEAAIDKVFDTVAPSNAKADTVWVGLALAARTPPKAKTRQKAVVAC